MAISDCGFRIADCGLKSKSEIRDPQSNEAERAEVVARVVERAGAVGGGEAVPDLGDGLRRHEPVLGPVETAVLEAEVRGVFVAQHAGEGDAVEVVCGGERSEEHTSELQSREKLV